MPRTGVFIQVRLGSTRLPGKALLPLAAGANIIQHVMRASRGIPAEIHALVTDRKSADELAPFARSEGFELFVGPEDDVLARYCQACREYRTDRIVRVTGDNPLTSASLARAIMDVHGERRADLSHYLGIPWGMGVEVIQAQALYTAERDAVDQAEREHITTYHYRHPQRFAIIEEDAPPNAFLPDVRITVDTAEDYLRVKAIFAELYTGEPIEAGQLVGWLRANDPGLAAHGG